MTKRKKQDRRTSSSSDNDETTRKQSKHDDQLTQSVSEAISEANSVLFESPLLTSDTNQHTNMAASNPGDNDLKEIKEEMKLVLSTVKDIKSSQDSMRKSFDSKLDKMRNEFMATLDGKIKTLRDDIVMDISRESCRIDQLEKTLQSLQFRLHTMENTEREPVVVADNGGVNTTVNQRSLDDPDLCIIVSGLADEEGENTLEKAKNIINALGDGVSHNVMITGATRLRNRTRIDLPS